MPVQAKLFGFGGMSQEEAAEKALSSGLLSSIEDIDLPSPADGMTALSRAAAAGQEEEMRTLLTAGADINAKGDRGMSALYHAITGGHDKAVEELLKSGADSNDIREDSNAVLLHACGLGREKIVKQLLENGADVNYAKADGFTALMAAMTAKADADQSEAQTQIIKALLAAGADPNMQTKPEGETALLFATRKGLLEASALLLDAGADEYLMGKEAAGEMVVDMGLVQSLAGLDAPAAEGRTPLGAAAARGDVDGVKLLLCAGADVNALDQEKMPALYISVSASQDEVVSELLQQGANPSHVQQDGNSVLMHACGLGRAEVVKKLLAAGADVNYAKQDGFTALMSAVKADTAIQSQGRQVEIVGALIGSGADVNMKTREGKGALAMATEVGDLDMVDLLVDNGATRD